MYISTVCLTVSESFKLLNDANQTLSKTSQFESAVKVYMTDFFLFAQSNLPNVLKSTAKKFFHSDFPFP